MRWLLLCLPLAGCSLVDQVKDKISPYTETTALQGLVLNITQPDDSALRDALAEVEDWEPGLARATVFGANAAEVADLENAPIEGASVVLRSDSLGKVELVETEPGRYDNDTLDYPHGEELEVTLDDGRAHKASTLAAGGLKDLDIPSTSEKNRKIVVDATGESVDALLVVLIDADSGRVLYDSTPKDVQAMYEFAHGDGSLEVELSGDLFAEDGLYAVGVAGLKRASEGTFVEINALLSTFMAGEVVFYPVRVGDVPADG